MQTQTQSVEQPEYTNCPHCGTADHARYDCPCKCHGNKCDVCGKKGKEAKKCEFQRCCSCWRGKPCN